ncbi:MULTISPECIES: GGDEF domain-containing protein [Thalassotalea]|uniref:diguanylate cyclase n=1 Tax=Thalassotalea castellviae TaxID=3075612 RepID=A0ABU3A2U7_9GAMM|nr:GGDEF domain-containing protein [Thalassotalea sp. W431]MDT0604494.1 GGDEF domain-containing protein [Thalassotalea sp. W431]
MPHRTYIHRPTVKKDLSIIAAVNLFLLILYTQVDFLAHLYFFSQEHQSLPVGTLLLLALSVSVSFLIFAYRRIKELGLVASTLEKMSLVDPLSGLPNRRAGQISLITWCELAQKKDQLFTVYQVDLDKFKKINDSYGQIVGDAVIQHVAQRLNNVIPYSAQIFRWLDDNFLVVVPSKDIISPNEFALQLQECVNGKIMPATLSLTCSIAYAVWQKTDSVDHLLHNIEDALIQAKHKGAGTIQAV